MAQDVALPDVPVKIGGKNLQMKFGLRAILALQAKWKLSNQREVQAHIAENKDNLDVMIDVVWASLLAHQREITRDDVLDLLDSGDTVEAIESLQRAIDAGSPPSRPQQG